VPALVQGIRIQLRQGISEATVRLQPEHFGEVTIAVRLEKGMVSAQVRAEASGVCDWLAGQEESIRSNLSEHGLQLDRFVVQRDRPRERRETPQQSNRPRARQEPDAEPPRFEVAASRHAGRPDGRPTGTPRRFLRNQARNGLTRRGTPFAQS
jgi:ribosomal protein S9